MRSMVAASRSPSKTPSLARITAAWIVSKRAFKPIRSTTPGERSPPGVPGASDSGAAESVSAPLAQRAPVLHFGRDPLSRSRLPRAGAGTGAGPLPGSALAVDASGRCHVRHRQLPLFRHSGTKLGRLPGRVRGGSELPRLDLSARPVQQPRRAGVPPAPLCRRAHAEPLLRVRRHAPLVAADARSTPSASGTIARACSHAPQNAKWQWLVNTAAGAPTFAMPRRDFLISGLRRVAWAMAALTNSASFAAAPHDTAGECPRGVAG